jgi:hypothetical protein
MREGNEELELLGIRERGEVFCCGVRIEHWLLSANVRVQLERGCSTLLGVSLEMRRDSMSCRNCSND